MRKRIFLSLLLFICYIANSVSYSQDIDIILKSDPFWGTNNGNVVPGASLPWGMVKLSPDVALRDTPTSGYRDNASIAGFSHNHANGVGGAPRYGNIMLIPQSDSLDIVGYRHYDKQNECAYPGYYAVTLKHKNNDIRAELTATDKVGFHRYSFSKSYDNTGDLQHYIVIDASHTNKRIKNGFPQTYCSHGDITFVNNTTIEGFSHLIGGWGGDNPYTIYFCIEFDTPFIEYGVFSGDKISAERKSLSFKQSSQKTDRFGGYVKFKTNDNQINCKVGISYKNLDQARHNLISESATNFDTALAQAEAQWATLFRRLLVKGGNLNAQRNFYSALRSTMLMPTDVSGEIEGWNESHFWDIYCIWDTYRTVTPLYTLIYPEIQRKLIRCMLEIYDKKGYLPDSWIAGDYATVQGGSNSDVVLADAIVKNIGGFDYHKALEATLKNAETQSDSPITQGRFANDYNKYGYVRSTTVKNAVSRTLEYAYNDYCIAQIALACQKPMIYDRFGRRSMEIYKLFHPKHHMFWGKDSMGQWDEDFNPLITRSDSWNDFHFYEGGSMIYSAYVPHDMAGLIKHHGGKDNFKDYLNTIFDDEIFKMENEFEFLIPYLYNYIGDYASTAKRVNDIMQKKFLPGRNGIPGQDDSGAMSAWYVFSALGFMPIAGQEIYLIGTPQFDQSIITLENGKRLTIKAQNLSDSNIYINRATLNGKPLNRAWFRHSEIADGGVIEFEMSGTPNNWGNEILPPSLSDELVPRAMNHEEATTLATQIVEQMTTEEKISMIGGYNSFFIKGTEHLGMKHLYMSDATAGVHIRKELDSKLPFSVSFPAPIALAATWNGMLSFEMSKAIGEECRLGNIAILLGPGINIYRMSQNGRNFEYFGEDPYLASRITENYVVGMQSTGTMATLKHFVCNNNEHHRRLSNSIVSNRALFEIYLPAFKAGIDAGAACVMTSYNQVNGEYTAESYSLVTGILRKRLNFKGLVMSDWRSVYNPVKAIQSGLNLEMPGDYADWLLELGDTPFTHLKHEAGKLLNEGKISIDNINHMVTNTIATSLMMGAYDTTQDTTSVDIDFRKHEDIALSVGRESIVLLKNSNNILPILPQETLKKKILLTGLYIDTIPSGGGSSYVEGYNNITLQEALSATYGTSLVVEKNPTDAQIKAADYVFLSVGSFDREGIDRPFSMPDSIENLVQRVTQINPSTIVIVNSGGGIKMTEWCDNSAAILYAWFPGQLGYKALAEIISGEVNPSGRLPFTIERDFSDSPGYGYKPDDEAFDMPWQDEYSFRFPMNNINYDEDVFVGYRWYEAYKIKPLFAFGHGLSYTTFEYSDLKLPQKIKKGNTIEIECSITNTGNMQGKEVVQLYVGDEKSSVKRPIKELKGFHKIDLSPGETKKIKFKLSEADLSFYDNNSEQWKAEPGVFTIHIGKSSDNIALSGKFRYE